MIQKKIKKVVLAYSGGLDTSIIIPWLKENYGCEVIAMIADLGQSEDMLAIRNKALKTGAIKAVIVDAKKEFVTDYLFRCVKAGAKYESLYLLGTSAARPLIAQKQIELARREKADAVSHGATGKGNDQVRFELTYMALAPDLTIIAPWKDERWTITSREEAIDYARQHAVPIPVTKKKIYSEDMNIWHLSHEGGELEDPALEPLPHVYKISSTLERAPAKPEYITLEFKQGIPCKLNGKIIDPLRLIQSLNKIGGRHAIGHLDIVENRLVGIKSRGVYETPGVTILYNAHRQLENLVLDRDTAHFKEIISQRYAELVYYGQWFTPLRKALDGFVDSVGKWITGSVRLKLYKGNIVSAGALSPNSLYDTKISSFSKDPIFDQKDAKGFIKLFGLPMRIRALKKTRKR